MGEPAVAVDGGVDAERDAHHQGEERGEQGELDGGRQALGDQRRDRPALAVADAEFEPRRIADEADELDRDRVLEAEVAGELLAILDRRLLTDEVRHRVADEAEHGEGDKSDRQHDEDGLRQAFDDIGDHERNPPGKDIKG